MLKDQSIVITNTDLIDQDVSTQVKSLRISSLDIQRGFIMLLMAFCHCREYGGIDDYSNMDWNTSSTWLGTSYLDLIQQAFMSMIAAGGFFMLMGVGIIFFYQSCNFPGAVVKTQDAFCFVPELLYSFCINI